jgi:hypothetical protein
MGGNGALRVLSAGPIIQAVDGYPLNIFGHHADGHHHPYDAAGIAVATVAEAEKVVEDLVAGGSTFTACFLNYGLYCVRGNSIFILPFMSSFYETSDSLKISTPQTLA